MIKNVKFLVVVIILIILVLIVGLFAVKQNKAERRSEFDNDITFLKESGFANDDFQHVELGDSVETVEKKMGELTLAPEPQDGYDIYEFEDEETLYDFHFKNDILENVTMYAK